MSILPEATFITTNLRVHFIKVFILFYESHCFIVQDIAHLSIVPGDAECPETFQRCEDADCSCKGTLYHCFLCVKSAKKGTKACILKDHFKKKHWNHRVSCHVLSEILRRFDEEEEE